MIDKSRKIDYELSPAGKLRQDEMKMWMIYIEPYRGMCGEMPRPLREEEVVAPSRIERAG